MHTSCECKIVHKGIILSVNAGRFFLLFGDYFAIKYGVFHFFLVPLSMLTYKRKIVSKTMSTSTTTPLFQRPVWVTIFALTAAIAWGWAFPILKIGFTAFGITPDMTGSKMLYAGIRFASAGLIILTIARGSGHSFKVRSTNDWWFILAFALMNTTLHYFFFYIGMSHSGCARRHSQFHEHIPCGSAGLYVLQERQTDPKETSWLHHRFRGHHGSQRRRRRQRTLHMAGRWHDNNQYHRHSPCRTYGQGAEPTHRCLRGHRL